MGMIWISKSILAGVTALAALTTWLSAADWAQWRGPNRDGHAAAHQPIPRTLPDEPGVRWKIPVGEGYASPVVAGNSTDARVFYLDLQDGEETVHAVLAATGKALWRVPLDRVFKDDWGQGPRCTPVVDGEHVVVQSCRGELQCLRVTDGRRVWRRNYVEDFGAVFMGETGPAAGATRHGNTGSPLVDGQHLIVQAGGRPGAGVVCLEKSTGEVVWTSQDDTAGNAAPILAFLGGVRQVISFTASGLIGVHADEGTLLWRAPLDTRLGRHVTTPVVVGEMVLVGSYRLGLVAVKVTREGGDFKAEIAWTRKDLATNFSSPVAVDGYVYGVGTSQNVYCVKAADGELAWSHEKLIQGGSERAFASFLVMGQNILMLSDRGELILFAAKPTGFERVSRAQACGATWCSPAYADGRLFDCRTQGPRCGAFILPAIFTTGMSRLPRRK
jgi:outer membrane protein assembly factor BamB